MDKERRVNAHHKFFQDQHWQKAEFVGPGEFYRSDNPNEMMIAETGTGIIICIYDPLVHVGGMTHILMPEDVLVNFNNLKKIDEQLLKTVKAPLGNLIKSLKQKGAGRKRIHVRIYGGAEIFESEHDVGLKNYVFSHHAIFEQGLQTMTRDIGGEECRRIHFFPFSGRVDKILLRRKADKAALRERELEYLNSLSPQ